MDARMRSIPLNFSNHSVNDDNALKFFNPEVNKPASINITPCPNAKRKSIKIAKVKFFPIAAKAIIPARIGVEHGVPARAKVIPRSIGYKNRELVEFVGMDFIIVGVSNSRIFNSFSPIINNKDAINTVK